jgi:hypothetical protein
MPLASRPGLSPLLGPFLFTPSFQGVFQQNFRRFGDTPPLAGGDFPQPAVNVRRKVNASEYPVLLWLCFHILIASLWEEVLLVKDFMGFPKELDRRCTHEEFHKNDDIP